MKPKTVSHFSIFPYPLKHKHKQTSMEEGEGERISLPRKDVRSHSFDSGLRDSLLQGNGEEEDDFATLSATRIVVGANV